MTSHKKINLSHVLIYMLTMLLLIVVLPYVSIKLFPSIVTPRPGETTKIEIPETIKVYITAEKKYEEMDFEKYVQGVVSSEMPKTFEIEALKAQAVAVRTYALGRVLAGSKICDTVHCQVYNADNISSRIKKAVKATEGQVVLYDDKLAAHTLYFSSSAGKTENSQDVFSTAYPYLVSVKSDYEPGATHKEETLTISLTDFAEKIKAKHPKLNLGAVRKSNIKIKSYSDGGRVKTIKIGRETLSGTDIRSALGLYSTRFKISFKGENIVITTSGSGHGVGMSQYGANGMAKKGSSYDEILSHYYQGTTLSS